MNVGVIGAECESKGGGSVQAAGGVNKNTLSLPLRTSDGFSCTILNTAQSPHTPQKKLNCEFITGICNKLMVIIIS